MNKDNLIIELRVTFPDKTQKAKVLKIDSESIWQNLEPLPRDREIYEELYGFHPRAEKMKWERKKLAEFINGKLGQLFIDIIESRDPVNGYYPDDMPFKK